MFFRKDVYTMNDNVKIIKSETLSISLLRKPMLHGHGKTEMWNRKLRKRSIF